MSKAKRSYQLRGSYRPANGITRYFDVTAEGADVEAPSGGRTILTPSANVWENKARRESIEYHSNPETGWVLRIGGVDGNGEYFKVTFYADGRAEASKGVELSANGVAEETAAASTCAGCGGTHEDDDGVTSIPVIFVAAPYYSRPMYRPPSPAALAQMAAYREPSWPLTN